MSADAQDPITLSQNNIFDYWLSLPGEWVEAPNIRRGGESGVKRIIDSNGKQLYRKQQIGHIYRSIRHPLGYPTAMRELDVLKACAKLKITVPTPVYASCRKANGLWQALLVTEALDGFASLEECYARSDEERWGEPLHQQILQELGVCLARLNSARWQHGSMRLAHIFVRVKDKRVDIALLDLEKSRKRFSAQRAAKNDIQQLKRHSSWTDAQWQAFSYGYQTAFGSAIKGL